jgi:hypothetical protein
MRPGSRKDPRLRVFGPAEWAATHFQGLDRPSHALFDRAVKQQGVTTAFAASHPNNFRVTGHGARLELEGVAQTIRTRELFLWWERRS